MAETAESTLLLSPAGVLTASDLDIRKLWLGLLQRVQHLLGMLPWQVHACVLLAVHTLHPHHSQVDLPVGAQKHT